jgi:hypothetical protein
VEAKMYLTESQIREERGNIQHLERMLEKSGGKISDKKEFMADLNRRKKILEEGTPRKATGREADRLYNKAKKLREELRQKLVPQNKHFLHYPKEDKRRDLEVSVSAKVKEMTDRKLQDNIRKYKDIMRRVDPSDPTVTDIDFLRK